MNTKSSLWIFTKKFLHGLQVKKNVISKSRFSSQKMTFFYQSWNGNEAVLDNMFWAKINGLKTTWLTSLFFAVKFNWNLFDAWAAHISYPILWLNWHFKGLNHDFSEEIHFFAIVKLKYRIECATGTVGCECETRTHGWKQFVQLNQFILPRIAQQFSLFKFGNIFKKTEEDGSISPHESYAIDL